MLCPTLPEIIRKTEEKWLELLSEECKRNFSGIHLPSHDVTHHQRVWQYAKILLLQCNEAITQNAAEQLIISVYFHDQGMSRTLAKEHGRISADLCTEFFKSSGIEVRGNLHEISESIENHDNKNYLQSEKMQLNLQNILNIADDLDALGILGAYRYLEIYLLRGTDILSIPETVLKNLQSRFDHLSGILHPDFVELQKLRFKLIRNYFEDLGRYLDIHPFDPEDFTGPAGVANFIRDRIIVKKKSLDETCNEAIKDPYCREFFLRLQNELNSSYQ